MNKKLKRKQALIMAEPYRTPFNSKVAKVSGDVIEDSIGEINKPTRSYDFKVNGFSNVVKSSNLLLFSDKEETTADGITYSIKNGVITLNGTNSTTSTVWIWIDFVSSLNGSYSFNSFVPTTTYSSGTRISLYDNTTEKPIAQLFNNEYSSTIELTNYECKKIGIACGAGQAFTNATIKPMLVSGSTIPTTFEPYFEPYIESFADKKNLLDLSQISDIAFSNKDNQTITYNKDRNGAYLIKDYQLENGTYEVSLILKTKLTTSKTFNYIVSGTTQQSLFTSFENLSLNEIHSKQIEVTENKLSIILWIGDYQEFDFQMMIIKGKTTPTTFLPYQDKYSAFLNVKGKNLLEFDDQDLEVGGVKINIKNGIFTLNGTANGTHQILYMQLDTNPVGIYSWNNFGSGKTLFLIGYVGVYSDNETHTLELNNDHIHGFSWQIKDGEVYDNYVIKPTFVKSSIIPTEYEPYYSFIKEVLIKQPLRKFDYLTYDGVYRQTNEIVLDGTNNIYVDESSGVIQVLNIPNVDSLNTDWGINYASQLMVTTSNLPLIQSYLIQVEKQKGIGTNNGRIFIKLDDSADNSLNNWTVEKVNNYFKQNPITITYKTVDQTFEATSLTRLLFKNGYNKITAFDSINNNAIVEYLEYYKSKDSNTN